MSTPMLLSGLVIIVSYVVVRALQIIKYRHAFRNLHGPLKAPPFNLWLGTILGVADLYKNSPADTHPHATMTLLHRKHKLGALYFLDNWPAAPERQLVINDPELAFQAVQKNSLEKHWLYPRFIGHIVGNSSLVLTEGATWKKARTMFNPGFSTAHLITLVPDIIDDVLIFKRRLGELADSGNIAPIEDALARLTIDIMGHIILDHDLNSQTGINTLVEAFRSAVDWTPNPVLTHAIFSLNPVRAFAHWYYTRIMDGYIRRVIQSRLDMRGLTADLPDTRTKDSRRPIIDLAIDQYLLDEATQDKVITVDENFHRLAIDQMKTFLFAGYDTTSSTICFIYHLLNRHPEALHKVQQEHDEIFGERQSTADLIKASPNLLNNIPYTTAVIKETLRLYPPASTTRAGTKDFDLIHNGTAYPTNETMVWINLHTIHRRPDLFPSPDEFIPERFLPPPHCWKEIPKHAYRPFEKGPRACIGQELAMLEMKIVLALTLRDFDISTQYEEWDRSMGRASPGETLDGRRGMFGDRAYQVMKATAKPSDGLPVRVKWKRV
ncbi:hypothetical protein VTL71DRAFT_9340 [Oculimacula yallundae]|uniref:Cytochrome P450 n=1 Tax=Oculimacula yallundae TaxID=86028 RepID=A0ABR4BSU5_9HELO